MGDWIILRFPFDKPDKPEVVEVLADVPIDWKEFLKRKASEIKKQGRYVVANILYGKEHYYPPSKKRTYEKVEKESE